MRKRERELLFEIPDISVAQYFSLREEEALKYDIYVNTLNPSNRFCGKLLDTSKLTYEQVELMRLTFRSPTIDGIMDLFVILWKIRGDLENSAEQTFLSQSVFDLFRAKNFVQNFLTELIEKEKKMLTAPMDEKNEIVNAGERLAPVSYILTKNNLAERFSCMPRDIAKMKYSEIFLILLADKIYADVSRDRNQIK